MEESTAQVRLRVQAGDEDHRPTILSGIELKIAAHFLLRMARELGAQIIQLKASNVADALIEFARREGITHVIFGQSARSRWEILLHGSVINRFLSEVRDATVQVVPLEEPDTVTENGH